jgi:acetate kinase
MRSRQMSLEDIEHLLYRESGLRAIAGLPGGVFELEQSNDPHAREAIAYFVYRTAREIGSLAAALGGLDVLVFTGGVGANSASIRQDVCSASKWLGVDIDDAANRAHDGLISSADSSIDVRLIPTSEEYQIACHTADLLSGAGTA